MRTTIPIVKAALLERLGQRPGLAEVLLLWGLPAETPRAGQDERIYLARTTEPRPRRSRGNLERESYQLQLVVEVITRNDRGTSQAAETRLWELVWEIQDQVEQPLNAGVSIDELTADPAPEDVGAHDEGWLARTTVTVGVTAGR